MQLRPSSTISTTFLSLSPEVPLSLSLPSLPPCFLVAKGDKGDGPQCRKWGGEGGEDAAASFPCVSVFVLRIQPSLFPLSLSFVFRKCSGMRRMGRRRECRFPRVCSDLQKHSAPKLCDVFVSTRWNFILGNPNLGHVSYVDVETFPRTLLNHSFKVLGRRKGIVYVLLLRACDLSVSTKKFLE